MMNNIRILCIVLASFCVSAIRAEADSGYIYREELEQLQKSADFQLLFDKDMPASLKNIRRDVSNYQQLTYFQRWVRSAILNCNALVVTSKTMPKLFAYIGEICKQAEIQTPTVWGLSTTLCKWLKIVSTPIILSPSYHQTKLQVEN